LRRPPQPLQPEKLRSLRPAFKPDGTITAANAPNNSDGAAAVVLVSGKKARELGLPVLARVRGWGEAAQAPEYFTTSPSLAIPKALRHAGVPIEKVDLFEINEGWGAVVLAMRMKNGAGRRSRGLAL